MKDLFERPGGSPACLSAWTVSQLAAGILEGESLSEADAHLRVCESCRARVATERREVEAAQREPVPAKLLERARATPRGARVGWACAGAAAVATAAAALLAVVDPSPRSVTRVKGTISVNLTVRRGETVVARDQPAANVGPLQVGDRVRLQVVGTTGGWVACQGYESDGWQTYYEGDVPEDRWLPVGVRITARGESRLRVVACPQEPPSVARAIEETRCSVVHLNL